MCSRGQRTRQWLELEISSDSESADAVAEVFRRYGGREVVIEQRGPGPAVERVLVKTYLPVDRGLLEKRARIDVALHLLGMLRSLSPVSERSLAEEDWALAWRNHFTVLHIGQRTVICPTWLEYSPEPLETVIRLDPGMAFGTGLHPTTRLCLELLERYIKPGMSVLDVGTGSGILAIAAARLGADRVQALDIDPVAVRVARNNVAINGVEASVRVSKGTLARGWRSSRDSYDVISANITAKAISDLAPAMMSRLRPGGVVITGGVLSQQARDVARRFSELKAKVVEEATSDDWCSLVFERSVEMD